jgi:hypothetical protein
MVDSYTNRDFRAKTGPLALSLQRAAEGFALNLQRAAEGFALSLQRAAEGFAVVRCGP